MSEEVRHFVLETKDLGIFDVVEYKEYLKQKEEIERLHSIIKEVRELLVKKSLEDIGTGERYTHGKLNDYLEILDKENENGNN